MSFDPREAELSKEAHDLLRFLIADHAFSTEFIVTAIQEYYQANSKSRESGRDPVVPKFGDEAGR